jgi:hypothetical protein
VKRWLVVFCSHPSPPSDATIVDVRARSELHAIAKAQRENVLPHPWGFVQAYPWPKDCADVDDVMAKHAPGYPQRHNAG